MSSPNRSGLPDGAFITTFNGKRCTAVPRAKTRSNNQNRQSTSTSHSTSTSTSTSSSTTRSTPPPQTSAPPVAAPSAPPPPPPPPPPPQTTTPPPPPPPPPPLTTSPASTTSSSLLPPPPPPPPPPPVTTPSLVPDPPLQQTQAPPAPIVSSPPPVPPPVVLSSSTSSAPPLIDAEPARTIPTFQQIPSIPPQSVPLPAQLPPPISSSSSIPPIPNSPPLPFAPGTSQTDANAVPTPPTQTPPAFLSDVSPSPTSNPAVVAPTVGLNPGLNPGTAAGEAGNNAPSSNQPSSGSGRSGGVATPVVIASSVVGAVAVVGLVGFLLWFWRKRWLKKRRSTLLTPLSTDPSFRTGEKPYVIDRESLGPTPRSAKLKAALGYNFRRFGGQVGSLVSRNRDSSSTGGRSQFMNVSQHSRNSSTLSNHTGPRDVVTAKDRLKDWWERLTADMKFNWRLRGENNNGKDPFAATRGMKERKVATGGQPDFLTLLGMDEREVEREAQRRRLSRGKGSAGSADHFLGGLGLNFDGASANPFSDINALPHDSAKPAPLAVTNPSSNNPFSDANAIPAPAAAVKPPTTYVADVRRSRGTSIGGSTTRPPSGSTFSPRLDSMYRDSMQSVESFSTRRNKFRSDPFDLERPELLGNHSTTASSNYSSQVNSTAPRVPGSAHTRSDSFSSKYSSGVSMDGWSDPGPDVGPAGPPSGGPSSYRFEAESPVAGYRAGEQRRMPGRRPSQGSNNSVGKAL